ncbi:MAG: class I SAM-dependent methyltransferase [Desulfobacterales bacterium]|nr:class I SAM-dependent methyltransferase [Desulfobacterales bacterium]
METNEKYRAQATMLANRVKKRYKHLRKKFKKQNLEVFRLYDWDIPEIRAVVDWYAGHLVVGEYSRNQSAPEWLPLMGEAVARSLNVPEANLHLKIRKAGIKEGTRYSRINHKNQKFPVWERDLRFLINPSDYVDTGLFSDHRNTRHRVREMAAGKDFLNLYCYTGAFTCYAAKGGAASTVSVDRSETAINWVKENLELNHLTGPGHTQVRMDTLDFLEEVKIENRSFDLAVVDPPSYSTTRRTEKHFDIARDYPQLLNQVFSLMRPGGTLFFSTNHQNFELKTERLDAEKITEITDQTIPEDYINKRKKIHRCWEISF